MVDLSEETGAAKLSHLFNHFFFLRNCILFMFDDTCEMHEQLIFICSKNTRKEYKLIVTVSLFLTGRHGQPQNNREGPETGRGL